MTVPTAARPVPQSSLADALVVAALSMGIVVSDDRLHQAQGIDQPSLLARVLDIPVRRVSLDGEWWKGDSGAYVVEDTQGSFAAAIPRGSRYVVVQNSGQAIVDGDLAATLRPDAWSVTPMVRGRTTLTAVMRVALGQGLWREFALASIAGISLIAMGVATPILAGLIMGELVPIQDDERIWWIGVLLALLAVASFVIYAIQWMMVERVIIRVNLRVQAIMMMRLVRYPMRVFRDMSPGDLLYRLQMLDSLPAEVVGALARVATAALLVASGTLVMLVIAPVTGVIVLGLLVILLGSSVWMLQHIELIRRAYVAESIRLSGFTLSLLTGISKARVAGADGRLFDRWSARYLRSLGHVDDLMRASQKLALVTFLLPILATLAVVLAYAEEPATANLGSFTALVTAAGMAVAAAVSALDPIASMFHVATVRRAVDPLMAAVDPQDRDTRYVRHLSGAIEVHDVDFAYGPDDEPVLRGIELSIEPGEFVAIVVSSGSCKSTLVRVMIGLESPTRGSVSLDGADLASLDIDSVHELIGAVIQSGQLAAGSILDNILSGSDRTEDEAWEAARLAGISADIEAMPMGMQTIVSAGGAAFSGGQRQRILLARAMVRKPTLMVLDEATSALDNPTQSLVSSALKGMHATRIVVAQRLSTIVDADRILVVEDGRIVEQGSYAQLIAADGRFARLADGQGV